MNLQRRLFMPVCILAAVLFSGASLTGQTLSYTPGAGIKFESEEEGWKFRTLGYIQSTFTYNREDENKAIQNDFFVRRARLDFIFNYKERYQIFFELDGRGSRTELVLAQLDIDYYDGHQIEIGKFITPFSPENYRSSRGLSTVERYSGLNSLFLLPSIDTQYGIMFWYKKKFEYYVSITNGNGKASDNLREDNNAKDFQGRLVYNLSDEFKIGASGHYADEETQTLSLVDHTFGAFNSASIRGGRIGYLVDFEFNRGAWLFRGEGFQYHFNEDLSPVHQVGRFLGAYGELGYFVYGDGQDGFQLIGRYERSSYEKADPSLTGPSALNSVLLGHNWYLDGVFRLQTNFVFEMADEKSQVAGRFEGKKTAFQILSMLQLKF